MELERQRLARILARAMNCTNKDANGEPCGCCPNCQSIMNGTNPDVIELDAARNRSVEDARKLIEQTQYAPQVGKRKVFIIDEVHMFSTEAFNSLLKTLKTASVLHVYPLHHRRISRTGNYYLSMPKV